MGKKNIIAHIPVLHEGYKKFLEANAEFSVLYILGRDVTNAYREIQKDIRAIDPELVKKAVAAWYPDKEITVATGETLGELGNDASVVMPDEDICRELAEKYFHKERVEFYPVFLRWDRQNSTAETIVEHDMIISTAELDKALMSDSQEEGLRSSDIWRRVGALISQNGKALIKTHNQSMPHEHASWIDGDPRNNYKKGVGIEMSTFIHAEAKAVAELAKKGVALEGTAMYVTTFPCPPCAMLIANAGIKKLYFTEGYGVLNGARALRDKGVQLIKVDVQLPKGQPETYVPYPEQNT